MRVRSSIPRRRAAFGLTAVLLPGIIVAVMSSTSDAEVKVAGNAATVRVTVSRDSISDVLSAVTATLKVRYRTSVPLDTVISGTYSGSLDEVMSRILGDYDYVIRHDHEAIEIVVFARHGESTIAAQPPPAEPATGRGVTWR
jgi:hypothetical protein